MYAIILPLLFLCQGSDFIFIAPIVEAEVGVEVGGSFFISEPAATGIPTQGFSLRFGVSSVVGLQTVVPGAGLVGLLGHEPEFFMHFIAANGIENFVGCVYFVAERVVGVLAVACLYGNGVQA